MAEQDPIEIAARALQHRDRSRQEIDARLAEAGVDEDRRADALDHLERFGYVDDQRFATARAEALAARGHGDESIRVDLDRHGVAAEPAALALAGLEAEADRARALAQRLGRTPKTAAQLARKGFSEDAIEAAVGIDVAGTDA
jgi:regulatory protein